MLVKKLSRNALIASLCAACLAGAAPAIANDSEAEISIGGITLKPSTSLRMDSEDLFISADIVRVKYLFTNPTDSDITTTVAFPLPAQPREMGDQSSYPEVIEPWTDFGFATHVDGLPVRLHQIDRAMIGERDVTHRVAELGFPLYWFKDEGFVDRLNAMDPGEQLYALRDEGIITRDEEFDGQWVPAWDVHTYFTREQTFPANSSITVEHEYAPYVGGSVGGALYKSNRDAIPEIMQAYERDYCVDPSFIAGFDKRVVENAGNSETGAIYMEHWLGYILSSGSNWNGPIGRFRLVVDKGSPDNLVSFCMDGVKKTSPTTFEVQKADFEPSSDLNILILQFYKM